MKKAVVSLSVAVVMLLVGFVAWPTNSFGTDVKETAIDIPAGVSYISDIKTMPDGSVVLTGGNQQEKTLTKYVSKNQGKTWMKECEYLHQLPLDLSGAAVVEGFATVSDDGYVAIAVYTYEKDLHYITSENEDELGTELYAYIIKSNGDIIEVDQPVTDEYGGYLNTYFAGDKLYFDDIRGNMYEIDRDNGKLIGRVMEDTNFHGANLIVNGDELSIVTEDEMGYPCGTPFPKGTDPETWQLSEDWQAYSFVADTVEGEADTYYIADIDGISIYSKANGKQLIHKNNRSDVNQYSDFYDIAVINDDTVIVHSWNEKNEAEQLIKYKIMK